MKKDYLSHCNHLRIETSNYIFIIKKNIIMINLKTLLTEGFAWERKEGKSLPTLAEVQAEYNRKLKETHNAKPDYRDADSDGNETESWNDAEQDKLKEGRKDLGILDLVSDAMGILDKLHDDMATNSAVQRNEKRKYIDAYNKVLGILSDIRDQAERDM